ncbi:MAG TPA: glycogen-binding domain-containing protein, partial [Flavobacteriales bacterium]|nr:glycogen-binding domain-containing protein [Flavobacteriales bacterium]
MTKYGIHDGKMVVTIGKEIKDAELDEFIQQFELFDLALKRFVRQSFADSLRLMGWHIDKNTAKEIVISKSLMAIDKPNPVDMIVFAGKHAPPPPFADLTNKVAFGSNRFKNKKPFREEGRQVTFFLRNNSKANTVVLAGNFNNWDPDKLKMTKTDSGWIATLDLDPGKYWYKFIVDGRWIIDGDNALRENDGQGNVNSVYYKSNIVFKTASFPNAKKVFLAGSFAN